MTGRRQPRKLECRPVRNGNLLRGFVAFPEVAVHLAGSPYSQPWQDRTAHMTESAVSQPDGSLIFPAQVR